MQPPYWLHFHILDEDKGHLGRENGKCALERQKFTFRTERQRDALKASFRFGRQDLATGDLQTCSRENFADSLLRSIARLGGILGCWIYILLTRFAGVIE